jgi:hypothetical protein
MAHMALPQHLRAAADSWEAAYYEAGPGEAWSACRQVQALVDSIVHASMRQYGCQIDLSQTAGLCWSCMHLAACQQQGDRLTCPQSMAAHDVESIEWAGC